MAEKPKSKPLNEGQTKGNTKVTTQSTQAPPPPKPPTPPAKDK